VVTNSLSIVSIQPLTKWRSYAVYTVNWSIQTLCLIYLFTRQSVALHCGTLVVFISSSRGHCHV